MDTIEKVYDLLSREYHSDAHKTVKCFQGTQRLAIIQACLAAARRLGKRLEDVDVLNIGCGESEQRRDLCILSLGLFKERIMDSRMTDLDISQEMLKAASQYYPSDQQYLDKYEGGKTPKQIYGDVCTVTLPRESYDIAIGALADHITDQSSFYRNVFQSLKTNGTFIVTYPHKRTMQIIRRDIYGIDVNHTRFIIDGKEYLIPSLTMDSGDVRVLFRDADFKIQTARTLFIQDGFHPEMFDHHPLHPLSNTLWQTKKLLRCSLKRLPLLAFGVGVKPS